MYKNNMDAYINKCAFLANNSSLVKCGAVMSGAMAGIARNLKDMERKAVNYRKIFEKLSIDRYI